MLLIVFNLLLVLCTEAVPNVFQYEIEKAKEYVRIFEIDTNKDHPTLKKRVSGSFEWRLCNKTEAAVYMSELSILPDPLAFPGDVTVSTYFNVTQPLLSPLKGKIVMKKKEAGFYIEIPCVEQIGSCIYDDICELLALIPEDQCPDDIKKMGNNCACPFKIDRYKLNKGVFNIPPISFAIAGEYQLSAELTQDGAEAFCLEVRFQVA